jgi:ribosomal protein L35AE/L33A
VNSLSQKTFGRITNYRVGPNSQQTKECLIAFDNITSVALGGKLLGQKVIWKNGKNKFTGKVVGMHGKNGMVRVKFANPVPGQALGTIVELVS